MIQRRRLSRIGARLLAFNLLLLFLPLAAILYLDVYEARLLDAQERSMGQQGGVIAAALGDNDLIDPDTPTRLLTRLGQRSDARLRIYDRNGAVLADSNTIRYPGEPEAAPSYPGASSSTRERVLYRLGAWLARIRGVFGRLAGRQKAPDAPADRHAIPSEVEAALRGRYGAATRPTQGQRSLTLSVAIPIHTGTNVSGAVLVSQSTFRVLQALYEVRLRIFEVVIGSLLAAVLLTAVAAATIVRPIRRLRDEAAALAERRQILPGTFSDAQRRDELGDLARALSELTRRLDVYIRETDRFAADVSHEFKNPLASIRAAVETAADTADPAERDRFLIMVTRDVDRLERLVSAVREQTRIDARLDQEQVQNVDITALVSEVIEGLTLAHGGEPQIKVTREGARCVVRASRDRLAQVIENVLANARSFTAPGTTVDVDVSRDGSYCSIEVSDRGPGIPPEHRDRIFDRFFSYRPDSPSDRHAGIGLSIARTIVESYGGTIDASQRTGGGATFIINLPLA